MRTFPGGRGGDEVEKVCGRRCCHQARKIDDNRALSLLMWEMCKRELDSYYVVATRKTKVSSGFSPVTCRFPSMPFLIIKCHRHHVVC
jgi:hypothetical protein